MGFLGGSDSKESAYNGRDLGLILGLGRSLEEGKGYPLNILSNNTRDSSTHGHHQMVNTEIRLTIFFVAKDGEALYSQQNKTRS